ncbi:MAG TPA: tetratricopeptide repeat protein [Pyrinomonadaceae bacterium]|nr:tetratricopeptide repeat protein [Pyrinomonadaceae bacterium]
MIKRFTLPLIIALCLLAATSAQASVTPKDNWISVQSKNFFLVGNASEKEVRQVAIRLEQFRDVFSRLFKGMTFTSPVPTTVIVFKNDSSYKPFKPVADGKTVAVGGYFQPGPDVNYITLTIEKRADNPYAIIFHEYVHLLVNNSLGKTSAPPWFNEGIAEYYSTFDIEDDRKVYLGNLISNHLELLRTTRLFPLDQLFAVDYHSLERNKHDARGLFYAQSWALIHYLIQGNEGKRTPQLSRFVDLLRAKIPLETAFKQAFQTDYNGMLKELKNYIQQSSYRGQVVTFEKKLEFDSEMKAAPITEAEAHAYLGDLLHHINRDDDAQKRLEQALAMDPKLAMARASLGMVFLDQKKFAEAKEQLRQAVAENSTNYLAHYYYAYVLSREVMSEGQPVYGIPAETAQTMRTELHRAIELKPDFPESYHLLAFVNLVTGEELDESIALIKRAVALSPGSEQFSLVLGQLYLRKQDVNEARKAIEPLAKNGSEPRIRENAKNLLASISTFQEQLERFRATGSQRPGDSAERPMLRETGPTTQAPEIHDPAFYLREALRKPADGETQIEGMLVRLDCDAKGITFVVKVGDGLLRLHAKNFEEMDITTFSPDIVGEISCGPRKPENNVVICYLPNNDAKAKTDGTIRSLEFVPKEFKLKS